MKLKRTRRYVGTLIFPRVLTYNGNFICIIKNTRLLMISELPRLEIAFVDFLFGTEQHKIKMKFSNLLILQMKLEIGFEIKSRH